MRRRMQVFERSLLNQHQRVTDVEGIKKIMDEMIKQKTQKFDFGKDLGDVAKKMREWMNM